MDKVEDQELKKLPRCYSNFNSFPRTPGQNLGREECTSTCGHGKNRVEE